MNEVDYLLTGYAIETVLVSAAVIGLLLLGLRISGFRWGIFCPYHPEVKLEIGYGLDQCDVYLCPQCSQEAYNGSGPHRFWSR